MPLNRDLVGRDYPAPEPYEVGRELVRRFVDAIGETSVVCRDSAAARALGHPDVIAPPTFLTVLMFRFAAYGPVADPELGLDYSLVVHGDQTFALHRPVAVGDVLSAVSQIEEIREVGRNEFLRTATTVTDADGALVATVRSTLVSRGTAAGAAAGAGAGARAATAAEA